MSSASAGKFQDHYVVLGIDPKSDTEAIHSAYADLAKKFHPNTKITGDKEKFQAVNQAYEVLMDASARAAFDAIRSGPQDEGAPTFSGRAFFEGLQRFSACRNSILSVLYDRRYKKPRTPGLSMRQMEAMLAAESEEIQLAVWYLKQKSYVYSDDRSNLNITVQGMDALEENPPALETIEKLMKSN
ncbi:MAG: DnaJ domain-containing protein [Bryobacterales bacterium]|nr:DnaJ domain-containing protein [Bryobacterales bacterium]